MMRVLHMSSERSWRGGEQQIAYLLQELPKLGVTCFVACRKGSAFEEYCRQQQIPHIALPFANEFDLYTAWRVKQYCEQQQIDLVHLHSGHSHAIGVWADVLGNKLPIVLHRRVDFPIKPNPLSAYKYNYPGIRRIICVSDEARRITGKDLKHPERCLTIRSCIDPARFSATGPADKLHREYQLPPQQPIVANVSALAPHKDYFTFIDTVAELVEQDVPAAFMAIGEGELRTELEDYARTIGLADRLYFTGFRKDVAAILPELAVLLITSRTEGLGSVILEAFAAGVPVVGTIAGGIPELVKHEQSGLLAPVGDATTLAAQVRRVLEEPGLANRLRVGGRKVVAELSCRKVAERTLAVYRQVLHQE